MNLTEDDIRNMSRAINLNIPESDLNTIALRLSALLSVMEEVEKDFGPEMDRSIRSRRFTPVRSSSPK